MRVYSGSGTSLLQTGWTLFQSGVSLCERRQAGVGVLYPLDFSALYVGAFPSGRGGCFSVSSGKGSKLSRVEQRADLEIDNGSV